MRVNLTERFAKAATTDARKLIQQRSGQPIKEFGAYSDGRMPENAAR